eukprot:7657882-Lingulodinium_polyedra.AAC.1
MPTWPLRRSAVARRSIAGAPQELNAHARARRRVPSRRQGRHPPSLPMVRQPRAPSRGHQEQAAEA